MKFQNFVHGKIFSVVQVILLLQVCGATTKNYKELEIIGIEECTEDKNNINVISLINEILEIPFNKEESTCYKIRPNALKIEDILDLFNTIGRENKEAITRATAAVTLHQKYKNDGEVVDKKGIEVVRLYLNMFNKKMEELSNSTDTETVKHATVVILSNTHILVAVEGKEGIEAFDIIIKMSYIAPSVDIPVKLFINHKHVVPLLISYGLINKDSDSVNIPASVQRVVARMAEAAPPPHNIGGVTGMIKIMRAYFGTNILAQPNLLLHCDTLWKHLVRLEEAESAIDFVIALCDVLYDQTRFKELLQLVTNVTSHDKIEDINKLRVIQWLKGLKEFDEVIENFEGHGFKIIEDICDGYVFEGKFYEAMSIYAKIIPKLEQNVYLNLFDKMVTTFKEWEVVFEQGARALRFDDSSSLRESSTFAWGLTKTNRFTEGLIIYRKVYDGEIKLYGIDHPNVEKTRDIIRKLEIQIKNEEF